MQKKKSQKNSQLYFLQQFITFIHAFVYSKTLIDFLEEVQSMLANGNIVANPILSKQKKSLPIRSLHLSGMVAGAGMTDNKEDR